MADREKEMMTVNDVQIYLGIGRDKAYTLLKSKSFPSMRIGKTYRVSKRELEDWVHKNAYRDFAI